MNTFNVPEMSCGHCTAAIKKAVTAVDSSATLTFDIAARKVDITSDLGNDAIANILKEEGYDSVLKP